ncbi:MAG: Fic family protein [Nanoarchaeota archaeon]|nr:Fic family protein [Nanoarchaeota archaeon]MBU1134949.1 Fic family protein [Nanoarchaeota archaeon]
MRAIKRKKGNNEYFYLQHSFRKGGKIITKEKYLGKKIPKNVEDIKKVFLEECNKISLFKLFEKIKNSFQKEWQRYPESMKEKVKEQIAIAFTYNTNAIEGSKITLEETRELIEHDIAPNKPLKDIKESESHTKIFLKILDKKEKFNSQLILNWHKELFQNTKHDIAGMFRNYHARVADYRAPDWQDVGKLMNKFIGFYKDNEKMNVVELASRMHYKFEKIHPFGDGNGRIGRLITNYVLWHNDYPMLIIEYKKRKSYYKALQKDEDGFFKYFARRYLKVHKKYLEKI